jgi:hypothetical protein
MLYDLSFTSNNGHQEWNTLLKRLNHKGDTLWSIYMSDSAFSRARNLTQEDDDAIVAVSVSYNRPEYVDLNQKIRLFVTRIDSNGNMVWKNYLPDSLVYECVGITKIATGKILVMCSLKGSSNSKLYCISPNGNVEWVAMHPSITSTDRDVQVVGGNRFRIYTHEASLEWSNEVLNYIEYDMNGNHVGASANSTPRPRSFLYIIDSTRRMEIANITSPDSMSLIRIVGNNDEALGSINIQGYHSIISAEKTDSTHLMVLVNSATNTNENWQYHIWRIDLNGVSSLPSLSVPAFSISPNPTGGLISLTFDKQFLPGKMNIFSSTGKQLKEITIRNEQEMIDLTNEAQGFYMLNYTSTDGKAGSNKRVIVTK